MALVGGDEQRPETFRGKFRCNTCGNSLASLKNLTRHMEKLHGRVEITCQICDLTLYSKVEFKEHSLTHVILKNSDSSIEIQTEGDQVMVASEHFQPDGSAVWLQQESLIELCSGSAVVKLQPKCHEVDLDNQDQVLTSALEQLRSQAEKLNSEDSQHSSAKVIVESLPQNTVLETIVLESHQANSQDHMSTSLTDVHSDSIIQVAQENCEVSEASASEIELADLAKEIGTVEPAMEVLVDSSEIVNSAVQESIVAITESNTVTLGSSVPNLQVLSSNELDVHEPVDVYSSHAHEPVTLTSGTHSMGKEYPSFVMHSDDGQKINLTNQEYQTLNTALSLLKSDEPKPVESSQEKETTPIEISIADDVTYLQEQSVQSESTKDQEKPTLSYDEVTTQPKSVEQVNNEGNKSVNITEILQSTVFDKTVEHLVTIPPLDGLIETNQVIQENDLSSNKQDNEAVIAASVDSTSVADKQPGFEFNNQNIEAFQVPLLELSGEANHNEEISCTSESHVDATAVQHDNVAINDKHGLVAIDFEAAVADALSTDTHAEPLATQTETEPATTVQETQINTETPVLSEIEGGTFVTDQYGPVQFVIQGESESYNINDSDILSHLQSILTSCSNETKGEPSLVRLFRCDEQSQPSTSSEQAAIPVAAPEEEQLKKIEDLPVTNPFVTTTKSLSPLKKTLAKRRTCGICRMDFGTTKELNTHKKESHKIVGSKPKRFVCQVCDRPFKSISALYAHMGIHSNEKPFLCHICDRSFSKHGNLYIHQLSHDKNKYFLCEYCGRSYSRPNSLSHHLLSLHNVKQDCKISDVFSKKDWQQYTSHLRDKTSIIYSAKSKDKAKVVVKKGEKAPPSKGFLNEQEVDLLDDGYAAVVDSDEASVSSESDSWINADLPTQKNKGFDGEELVADPSDEDIVSSTSESSIDDNLSEVDEDDDDDGLAKLLRVEKNFAKLDKKLDKDMAELGINCDSLDSDKEDLEELDELIDQQSSLNDSESENEVPLVVRAKATQPRRPAKRPTISSNLMDVLEQSADKIFENITRPRPRNNPPIKSKTLHPVAAAGQPILCEDPDEPNNEEEINLMDKLEQSARILFRESFIEPLNSVKEPTAEHNISFRFDEDTLENTDHNALVSNRILDKNMDSITYNKNLENPSSKPENPTESRTPQISLITPRPNATFRPIQSGTAAQSSSEQPQLVRISPLTFQSESPKKAVKTTKVRTLGTKKMSPGYKSKVASEETMNVEIPNVPVIEMPNNNQQFSSGYMNWLARIPGKIQKARKSFPNARIGSSFIKVMDSVDSRSPTPVSITGSPQLTPVKLVSPKPSEPLAKTFKKTVATSKKNVTKTKRRNSKVKRVASAKSKANAKGTAKRNLSASLNTDPPNEVIVSLQSKSPDCEKNLEDAAKYGENKYTGTFIDTLSTFKPDTNSQNDEPVPETSTSTVATNQGLDVSSIKKLIQDVLDEQKLEQSESVAEANQTTKSESHPGQSILKKKTNEPKKAISKSIESTPILAVNPLSRSTMQPITKPLQAVVPTVKVDPKLVTKKLGILEPKVNRTPRSKMNANAKSKVNDKPLVTELVKKKSTVTKSRLQKARKSFPGSATSNEMKMVVAEALVDIQSKKPEVAVKTISKSPLDTLNKLMQGLVTQNKKVTSVVNKPQTNTDCKERFTLPRLENQSKNMVHTAFLIRPAERANEPMPVFVYNKPGDVGSEDPKIKGVIIVPTLPSAVPGLIKHAPKPEMKTKVTNVVPPTPVSDSESTQKEDLIRSPTMKLRKRNKNQENVTASCLDSGTTSASNDLDLPALTSTPNFIGTPKTGSKKNLRLTETNTQPSLPVPENTSTSELSTPSSEAVKTVRGRGKLSISSLVGSKKTTSTTKLGREIPQKLRISEDLSPEPNVNIIVTRKTYTRSSVSPNLDLNLKSSDLALGLNYDDNVLLDQLDTKSSAKTDFVPTILISTCSKDIVSSSGSTVFGADSSCFKSSEISTVSIATRPVIKKKLPTLKTMSNISISKSKRKEGIVNLQETRPVIPIKLDIQKKTQDTLQNVTPRRSARKIERLTNVKSRSVETTPKKSKLSKNKVEKSPKLTTSTSPKSVSFADQVENRKTPSKVVVSNSQSMPVVPLRPTFDLRYFKHKRKFKAYFHTDAQNQEVAKTTSQNSTQLTDFQASSCERPSTELTNPMNVIAKSTKRGLKRTTAKNQAKEVLVDSEEPVVKRKNSKMNQGSTEFLTTSVNSADLILKKSKMKSPKSSVTQSTVAIKRKPLIPSVTHIFKNVSAIRKPSAPIEQCRIPKKRLKSASDESNLSTTYVIVKDPFVNVDIRVPVTSYVTSLKRARVHVKNCSALVSTNRKKNYIYYLKKL